MATKHSSHMVVTKWLTKFIINKLTNITFCLKVVEIIRRLQSAKIKLKEFCNWKGPKRSAFINKL